MKEQVRKNAKSNTLLGADFNLGLACECVCVHACVCREEEEGVMAQKGVGGDLKKKQKKNKPPKKSVFPAPYREGLAHEAATIKVISTFKVQY